MSLEFKKEQNIYAIITTYNAFLKMEITIFVMLLSFIFLCLDNIVY